MDDFEKALETNKPKYVMEHQRSFMPDVKRIGSWVNGARWAREWVTSKHKLFEEYETELEKLRLENAKLKAREINGSLRTYDGVIPKLEAEIEKLRGALEKVHKELKVELPSPGTLDSMWIINTVLKETGGDDATTDKTPIKRRYSE